MRFYVVPMTGGHTMRVQADSPEDALEEAKRKSELWRWGSEPVGEPAEVEYPGLVFDKGVACYG